MLSFNDLKDRARRGDAAAVRELRDRGFFDAKRRVSYPVSDAQRRLWVLDRMSPDPASYNVPGAMRILGALNADVFEQALAALLARHESLRTSFCILDGEVRQVIHADAVLPLERVDLTGKANPAAAARAFIGADAAQPFSLQHAPLVRAALLTLDRQDHVFAFNLHHIVCDAWSLGVLFGELLTVYDAFVAGARNPLAPLRIQYKDVAAWQRTQSESGALDDARRYWLQQLAGERPSFEFPLDYRRPAVQTFRGGHVVREIVPETVARLERLSATARTTLFTALLAATRVLLFRYTAQTDLIVGTPVSGRAHPDLEHQVGFYVNLVPLRMQVQPSDTFLDVLAGMRQVTSDAYAHEYPFDRLVDDLDLARDLSRSPLFDVLIAWDEGGSLSAAPHGLRIEPFAFESDVAKYDLTFFFARANGSLALSLNYNMALFSRERIEQVVGHFAELLRDMTERPDVRVRDLAIASRDEIELIHRDFKGQASAYPRGRSIADVFDARAADAPHATAVASESRDGEVVRVSYAELNARASRVARRLSALGVGLESRVGVLLERSERVPVALLGILKAGGCYVPLETSAPRARVEYIVDDAVCMIVVTERETRLRLGDDQRLAGARCVDITELEEEGESDRHDARGTARPHGRSLAYVMYTSGSTGVPKGTLIEQRSVLRLVLGSNFVQLGSDDRVLQTGSLAFDASTFEIWGPLLNGGTVCFAPAEDMLAPDAVRRLITRHHITAIWVTASLFNQWVDADAEVAGSLRYLLTGGEKLSTRHIRRVRQQYPDLVLINGYGPTENTTFTACHRIEGVGDRDIPIGRPVSNTDVYILDDWGGECGVGVPGEICAGGDGLARGYLSRPDLTAERFVPHPHAVGERLYRTGDRGRWEADGTIEFLGRRDAQVKVRGYRVELGEIEACLRQHPDVLDAAVIARQSSSGTRELVAYVVSARILAPAALRDSIARILPEYMIPGSFVRIPQLPLTTNGKLDREALPDPDQSAEAREQYRPPRTGTERALCDIWRDVLQRPDVGIADNFFALGGHSLKATRVLTRIHRELTDRLTLRDLFALPTIAELARRVDDSGATRRQGIARTPDADRSPASHAQRRLWLLERLSGHSAAYNVPGALVLDGLLDPVALSTAFSRLIARHESVRTTFVEIDGEVYQRVRQPFAIDIPLIDVSGHAIPEQAARELAIADASDRFALSEGPLFRIRLFRTAPNRHVYYFNLHHIITDGWSMRVLLNELLELYREISTGVPATLPELAIQYRDFAVWQREYLASPDAEPHRRYWIDRFKDEVPPLELPADAPRPVVQSFRGDVIRREFDAATVERLRRLGREQGATLYMVWLAIIRVLVARHAGQEEFVLGTGVAGREHADLASQVGFYVNMLPLRQRVAGSDSFAEVLRRTRDTVSDALEHQSYPFDCLVSDLQVRRELGRQPMFDVVVTLEETDDIAEKRGVTGLRVLPFELASPFAKFDLMFAFSCTPDGRCSVALEYSTDLFRAGRIQRMAAHVEQLVASVLEDPSSRADALNVLPREERRLLAEFAGRRSHYPADSTIAALFEAAADRHPRREAVATGERVLSYAELNQRSNVLAHTLRTAGIRPEQRVGVLLDRSERVAVALVGILKAGACYVPLDRSVPSERLAFMVADSECRVVVGDARTRNWIGDEPPWLGTARWLDLASLDSIAAGDVIENPSPAAGVTSRSLAYVMYTSGSTGQPKGTLIEQRAVSRLVLGTNYLQLGPGDRMLQTGSLAFDASTLEVWGPLLTGGSVCFAPADTLLDAGRVADTIARSGISAMFVTTSLFNQLVDADENVFAGLRCLMTGGEKVSVAHVNRVRRRHPALALLHVYGPTENTTFTTFYPVAHEHELDVPIGRPLSNTSVHVLDSAGGLCPIGIAGEICTGGDGLARGYVNRPDLTAERFVPDAQSSGERLYRTGDIGRWSADGDVEFLGRRDNQVKIRGYRVEPEEIEARLLQHPAVTHAAVLSRETTVGTRELVAYYAGGEDAEVTNVRSHLARSLPAYMVPSEIMRRDRLPLNRSGKVDRAALAASSEVAVEDGSMWEPPETRAEQVLAEVWQAVLGRDRIGRREHYFDAGGDSIRAIQIVNRLRKSGWVFDVRDVFQHPVLSDAALCLAAATEARGSPPVAAAGPVPLTPIQRWFLTRTGDLHQFNHAVLLVCPSTLRPLVLRDAIAALWRHHGVLRLALSYDESGQPVAMRDVTSTCSFDEVYEVREMSAADDEAWRQDMDAVQRGFTLPRGPLFRAVLYRRPEGARLLLVAHHLIIDGVSWRILLEDLEQAYHAATSGAVPSLTPQVHSYAEWAHALGALAQGTSWHDDHAYWTTACRESGGVVRRDAVGASAVAQSTYGSARAVDVTLTAEATAALLGEVHAAFNTTLDDLLLTAIGRALAQLHGSDRTWIAMEGHGREAVKNLDVSGTVGWFTSVFPFLLRLDGQDARGQVRHVKEALRTARRHALGDSVMRWMGATPALDVTPPDCRVSLNYMGHVDVNDGSGAFTCSTQQSGRAIAPSVQRDQDFEIGGIVREGMLTLSVTYDPHLHTEATSRRMLELICGELDTVVTSCRAAARGERTPSDYTACPLPLAQFETLLHRHSWRAQIIDDIYPLTPMQQGLLFQALLDLASRAYFLQLNYRIVGTLDVDRFQRAWYEVARRHAILRAAIVHEEIDQPLQVILTNRRPEMTFVDLSDVPGDVREQRIHEWRGEDMARGVNLDADPLMRIAILRLAPHVHHVVWSYHHVMLDGWSLGVLYRELLHTYRALASRDQQALPPPQPFSRYVRWLLQQDKALAASYWREYLSGYEPAPSVEPLASALDAVIRDEPAGRIADPGEYTITLSADVSDELARSAAAIGATLNTVMQTLWAVLLARYTGSRDLTFGAVVSGRPAALPGVEDMVGLFINTVPVRVQLDHEESFAGLVRRVQQDALRGEAFHFFPLADMQAANAAGRQLFDHLLVFENYPLDSDPNGGSRDEFRIESFEAHDRTHYDLDLTIVSGRELQIRFNYNPDVFSARAVARLAGHYEFLVSSALEDVERAVASLPLISADEQAALLDAGRGAQRAYPVDTPLAVLFERVAAASPASVAVTSGDQSVTYAALNGRANQMAHWLRDAGVARGDVVALLDRRGSDLIASMLAVLKVGGAFLPLDPDYPIERLRYMVTDSGARTIVTRGSVASAIGIAPGSFLANDRSEHRVLDLDRQTLHTWPHEDLPAVGNGRDIAYLLYTSGSTGVPKGALIRNDGAVNHIFAEFDLLRFHTGSVFLQSAPCSSDVAIWQCLAPGLIGARVVVAQQDTVIEPERLFALMKAEGVTLCELVPVVLKALLDFVSTLPADGRALPRLEWAMVTGEAAPVALVNQWVAIYPDIPLVNAYGPTEAADDVSQAVITSALPGDARTVPIGVPLPNVRLYVLDDHQQLVPFGVTGELCVAGIGVGAGYWRDEARTAAAFIRNPFAEYPHDTTLYRTGDRGRWRADGVLECLGRLDQQVKVRGVRIELEEVESALLEHPAVRQAAAGVRDVAADSVLVAWVVGEATPASLQEHLRARLPVAMVPSVFVRLDALPLTPNGKIDRRALPDPDSGGVGRSRAFVAPATPVARRLAEMWREVLQTPSIGLYDNFFERGGHSLKAMQVLSRIRRDLGVRVSLQTFFASPTLAALAASVAASAAEACATIEPAPPAEHYELSHAQRRLWLLHHLEGHVAYNMPEAVLLEDAIDRTALEHAFATLVARHEVLRTAFVVIDGEPRQRIRDHVAFTIREVDLSDSHAPEAAEARAASLAEEEAVVPFDLTHPPLLRAILYRLSPARAVFLMVMHHIVGDGWSMNVLYREVLALYDAYRRRQQNPLPTLRIQYKDFAYWQNRQDFTRDEQYWMAALAGAPDRLALPYDMPPSDARDFKGQTESGRLDVERTRGLRALAAAHGTTLSSVVLGLFHLVLYQWTRQTDVCVGLAIANRTRAELENLIGFFVNILPIRVQLASDMEFAALLAQVSTATTDAFEHQDYPFDRLVTRLNPGREGNRQPILNVIYAFQNFEDVAVDVGAPSVDAAVTERDAGALVRPFPIRFETSKFDLTLFVTEVDEQLRLSLEYDMRLFRPNTIRRVVSALERFAGVVG